MDAKDKRIEWLETEVERLTQKLDELEKKEGFSLHWAKMKVHLSPMQLQIISSLYSRNILVVGKVMQSDSPDAVRTQICALRKKFLTHKIPIRILTQSKIGYYLTESSKEWIRKNWTHH